MRPRLLLLLLLAGTAVACGAGTAGPSDPLERVTGEQEWRDRDDLPDPIVALRVYEESLRRWALARAHLARERRRMERIRATTGRPPPEEPPPPMSDADRVQRIRDVLAGRRAMRPDEYDEQGQAVDSESSLPERQRP